MPERASTTQAPDSIYRSLGYLAAILLLVGVFGAGFLLARSSTRTLVVQLPASSQQPAPAPQNGSTVADQADALPAPQPPSQAPAPAQPSSEAPAPVNTTSSSPAPTYREPEPPQPRPEPADPFPQSAHELAARFGGDPAGWSREGVNGWKHRGRTWVNFVVPDGTEVHTPSGKSFPGQSVSAPHVTVWWTG